MSPIIHDVPVLGIFTTAVADSFTGLIWNPPTEEELLEAFEAADTDQVKKLNRTGVAEALRLLDKSNRQVQKLVDLMPGEELDFEGFKELVNPGPLPWHWHMFGVFPLPNHEKIFDAPVLGHTLNATNDILAQPVDNTLRSWRKSTFPASDHRLAHIFHEADAEKNGKLDKKEIPQAMRTFYKTESEIKNTLEELNSDVCLYDFKKMIRGPKYSPSMMNYVPMVGPALATNVFSFFDDDVPEEDQKEAFDYIDKSKKGTLDKSEIADVLRELGKSELEVQKMIGHLPVDELDFEGFKDFMQNGGSRTYTTTVSGYPVPNPAKVHDLPLIGTATSLTQDVLVDTYEWTAGVAWKYFSKMDESELKAKFEELDTNKSGLLTKKEIAKGFRDLGMSEYQIKNMRDSITKDPLTLAEFTRLAQTGEVSTPVASADAGQPS